MSERSETKRAVIRLDSSGRLAGVDLARGLAVLGMFAAHLYALPEPVATDASTWWGIANGRSSILFATLAGVSIGLVTGGSRPLEGSALAVARGRLALRAVIVWAIGVLLISTGVPVFVILPAYGILFLLALPFLRLRARTVFVVAAGIGLVMPFVQALLDAAPVWSDPRAADVSHLIGWHYPFPVWIAFLLAGLGAARSGLDRMRTQAWLAASGIALAALGYGIHAFLAPDPLREGTSLSAAVWTARSHSTGVLEVVGSGGFALAVIGLCLLVCRVSVVRWVSLPLRAVGSMPLTAYVGQLVAWWILAATLLDSIRDLAGFRALDPFPAFAITALVACTAWALLIGRGPLEWLIDRVTRVVVPSPAAS